MLSATTTASAAVVPAAPLDPLPNLLSISTYETQASNKVSSDAVGGLTFTPIKVSEIHTGGVGTDVMIGSNDDDEVGEGVDEIVGRGGGVMRALRMPCGRGGGSEGWILSLMSEFDRRMIGHFDTLAISFTAV